MTPLSIAVKLWLLIYLAVASIATTTCDRTNECNEITKTYNHTFRDGIPEALNDCEYISAQSNAAIENSTVINGYIHSKDTDLNDPSDVGNKQAIEDRISIANQTDRSLDSNKRDDSTILTFNNISNKNDENYVDLKPTAHENTKSDHSVAIKENNDVSNVREMRKVLLDHLLDYIIKIVREDRLNDTKDITDDIKTSIEKLLRNYYDPNHLENYITEADSSNFKVINDFYKPNNNKDYLNKTDNEINDTISLPMENVNLARVTKAIYVTNPNSSVYGGIIKVLTTNASEGVPGNIFEDLVNFNDASDDFSTTEGLNDINYENIDPTEVITASIPNLNDTMSSEDNYSISEDSSDFSEELDENKGKEVFNDDAINNITIYSDRDKTNNEISTNKTYAHNNDITTATDEFNTTADHKANSQIINLLRALIDDKKTVDILGKRLEEITSNGNKESDLNNTDVIDSENIKHEVVKRPKRPSTDEDMEVKNEGTSDCHNKINVKIDLNVF